MDVLTKRGGGGPSGDVRNGVVRAGTGEIRVGKKIPGKDVGDKVGVRRNGLTSGE